MEKSWRSIEKKVKICGPTGFLSWLDVPGVVVEMKDRALSCLGYEKLLEAQFQLTHTQVEISLIHTMCSIYVWRFLKVAIWSPCNSILFVHHRHSFDDFQCLVIWVPHMTSIVVTPRIMFECFATVCVLE